jgi:hypothetical protein
MGAARFQLSAFSGQLLNERCEHAFDPIIRYGQ